jgi:hypothetical protein
MVAALSIGGLAQKNDLSEKSNDACLSDIKEKMLVEARKVKLELNENALTFNSTENLMLAFIPAAGSEKLKEEDFQKGVGVGLLFINSSKKWLVPNGYYRIQISGNNNKLKSNDKISSGPKYTASLLDGNGRSLAVLPVKTGETTNNPANFVKTTIGYCVPSMNPCVTFPAFTAWWQIIAWFEFSGL